VVDAARRRVSDHQVVKVRLGSKPLIDFEATDALLHRAE
jgi:hypothetical protein